MATLENRLSLVIPIYNSERFIYSSLEQLTEALRNITFSYEILLCDDGSQDHSLKALQEASGRFSRIRYFLNGSNQGLGLTLRKLFSEAHGEWIIYCDCDLPFGAQVIPLILQELEFYDIVVSSRYKGIPSKVRWIRRVCSRLYFCLCKILFNIPVQDIGSGTMGFRKVILEKFTLQAEAFDIHAEFYCKAKCAGCSFKELACVSSASAQGSFRLFKHGFLTVFKTLLLWYRIRSKNYS